MPRCGTEPSRVVLPMGERQQLAYQRSGPVDESDTQASRSRPRTK
jgi:hypothetical protein